MWEWRGAFFILLGADVWTKQRLRTCRPTSQRWPSAFWYLRRNFYRWHVHLTPKCETNGELSPILQKFWISACVKRRMLNHIFVSFHIRMCHTKSCFVNERSYRASHSRVAPENVGLQKEQKYNTFACHTCNEVRLCVLGIRKKEVGNTKR
jgi:hypothetical protein